jgi:hypothetical protein
VGVAQARPVSADPEQTRQIRRGLSCRQELASCPIRPAREWAAKGPKIDPQPFWRAGRSRVAQARFTPDFAGSAGATCGPKRTQSQQSVGGTPTLARYFLASASLAKVLYPK